MVLFNQTQAPRVTGVTAVPQTLPPAGGSTILHVVAPPGCTWAATTPVPSVTFPGGRSGVGSDDIQLSIRKNGSGAIRMEDVNLEQFTATIVQATPTGSDFIHTSDLGDRIGCLREEAGSGGRPPWGDVRERALCR